MWFFTFSLSAAVLAPTASSQSTQAPFFEVRPYENTYQSDWLEAASLVISREWLITSWLAQTTVSLTDVAGRTIAVTNAQSCSKTISSFSLSLSFFSQSEPMSLRLCPAPLLLESSTPAIHPIPTGPPAFPSCTQAHPCQHKTKAASEAADTWDALIVTYLCLTVQSEQRGRTPASLRLRFRAERCANALRQEAGRVIQTLWEDWNGSYPDQNYKQQVSEILFHWNADTREELRWSTF